MTSMSPSLLNEGQRRAYDIITRHLFDTLSGKRPEPLRMILYGEGGTGKSKVIQTVTEAFKQAGE
jgi:Cdc6-like AAA superfamily ATPase